ncbi:hypothetical protein N7466_011388 [Penicillium verhagenii]|uniref:uncharacterized protein n=1 Tax=Penicillium verhagenii TaxID=1562060 RepID=UPI0025457814|nr:uncharacterized protein N7466_011388 [Penicillium verhagenii]KAJ5915455.1 hypothetical protein N7466_011388 [Penicillium verhagenii]
MSADHVLDKKGETITQGDYVLIKSPGGHREGEVDKIVTDETEAQAERVVDPPKASTTLLSFSSSLSCIAGHDLITISS